MVTICCLKPDRRAKYDIGDAPSGWPASVKDSWYSQGGSQAELKLFRPMNAGFTGSSPEDASTHIMR